MTSGFAYAATGRDEKARLEALFYAFQTSRRRNGLT
jgi:hypothetical protein